MLNKNIIFLAFLYFLQGLPYGLQSRFLPLYFRSHGMSLSNIGFFKMLLTPWMLKALWAPLVDIYGSKQQWLSYSMLGLFLTCLLGALTSPELVLQLGGVLLLFNILTSTQDIAVDGLAIQILLTSELAIGNIAQVVGYKLGAVFSGGVLIWVSEELRISWSNLFVILSIVYVTAYFAVLKIVPQNSRSSMKDTSENDGTCSENKAGETPENLVKETSNNNTTCWIFNHFTEILSTVETRWMLLYVLIYKLGEQGALTMIPLYLVDKGIAAASIGFWTGVIGQSASIAGSLLGGWVVSRFQVSAFQTVYFFSRLRMVPLFMYPVLLVIWTSELESILYVSLITIVLVMLTGSGIITTTTFTLMMYCSQRAPPSIQASHYTALATVEVLGKLTFSVFIGSLTDLVGYTLVFSLFFILGLSVIPVLHWCPNSLMEMKNTENKNS